MVFIGQKVQNYFDNGPGKPELNIVIFDFWLWELENRDGPWPDPSLLLTHSK